MSRPEQTQSYVGVYENKKKSVVCQRMLGVERGCSSNTDGSRASQRNTPRPRLALADIAKAESYVRRACSVVGLKC